MTKDGVIRTTLAVYVMAKEEEKRQNKLAVIDRRGRPMKQFVIPG